MTLALFGLLSLSIPPSSIKAQEGKSATPSIGSQSLPPQDEPPSGQRVFTMGATITIPGAAGQTSGTAAPYQTSIGVSGFSGKIVDVNVQLKGITHTHPDDLDIMLVGPTGQSLLLMSDAGGSADLSNTYVAFDDSAPTLLPDSSLIAGTQAYKPTNFEAVDNFPAPAPAPSAATTLSVFDGTSPNGVWSLYVVDDGTEDTGSISGGWSLSLALSSPGAANVMDFDGDGKTDYAVVRNTGALNWYLLQSTEGFRAQTFGNNGDRVVPGDYDGDGRWDIAVWRPGAQSYFYIWRSSDGALQAIPFGVTNDDPRITQDFDGDGITDPAVTRNVGGTLTWYIQRSTLGFTSIPFGLGSNDIGIRGDYDGDGKADIAVYRVPSASQSNTFYILKSQSGTVQGVQFGNYFTDYIIPADFDGDNRTDIAVWRNNGAWYWLQSSDDSFHALQFGNNSDVPAPGDYDRDGKTDQVVWRSGSPATFYLNHSVPDPFEAVQFGATNDIVPGFSLQAR